MPKAAKGDGESKPRRQKAQKDPNMPKKPSGPYIFFCNENRENIKKEHPEFQAQDIYKALGGLWKELTDEEKQKYYEMAKEDKERYNKALSAYKGTPVPA